MYKIIGADGREYGPVSADTLRQWISEGRANAETRVLLENATEWKKLGEVAEFYPPVSPPSPKPISPGPAAPGPIAPLPSAPRTSPLAVTGLVLGIISITFGLCCYGFPFNVAGAICSAIALSRIRQNPQRESGEGIAIAGLVLSLLSIVFGALMLAFYFSFGSWRFLRRMPRW